MVPTLSLLGMLQISPDLIGSTNFPLPTGLDHEILDPLLRLRRPSWRSCTQSLRPWPP